MTQLAVQPAEDKMQSFQRAALGTCPVQRVPTSPHELDFCAEPCVVRPPRRTSLLNEAAVRSPA